MAHFFTDPPDGSSPLPVWELFAGLVLSNDTEVSSWPIRPTSVGEHCSIDELVRLSLPQIANDRASYFEANEAVMLCPSIFKAMCQNFGV